MSRLLFSLLINEGCNVVFTCFSSKRHFYFSCQDVGLAAGTADEGYFVPPVKGTSQSQVTTELLV